MATILNLIPELKLLIFQKTSPPSLCRFRQTCKALNNFVEFNKFRIKAQSNGTKGWILAIRVDLDANCHFLVGTLPLWDLERAMDEVQTFSVVSNPLKQFEAVKFDIVTFKFARDEENLRYIKDTALYFRQVEVFLKRIMPIVREMRIQCDWLAGFNILFFEECFKEIRFERLFMCGFEVPTKKYMEWPISHCKELSIHFFLDSEVSLSQLIGNSINAEFHFKRENGPARAFQEFLKDYITSNINKNLRFLKLVQKDAAEFVESVFGVSVIWKGRDHRVIRPQPAKEICYSAVYKVSLNDGMGVILYNNKSFELKILQEDSRESLLKFFCSQVFNVIPCECAMIFQQFMAYPNLQAAFTVLHNRFSQPC